MQTSCAHGSHSRLQCLVSIQKALVAMGWRPLPLHQASSIWQWGSLGLGSTFGEAAAHPNALSGRWVEVTGWLPSTGTLSSNCIDL